MKLKRYDVDEYAAVMPMSENDNGDYCLVADIIDELERRIAVTNTLPGQQIALKQLLEWAGS